MISFHYSTRNWKTLRISPKVLSLRIHLTFHSQLDNPSEQRQHWGRSVVQDEPLRLVPDQVPLDLGWSAALTDSGLLAGREVRL